MLRADRILLYLALLCLLLHVGRGRARSYEFTTEQTDTLTCSRPFHRASPLPATDYASRHRIHFRRRQAGVSSALNNVRSGKKKEAARRRGFPRRKALRTAMQDHHHVSSSQPPLLSSLPSLSRSPGRSGPSCCLLHCKMNKCHQRIRGRQGQAVQLQRDAKADAKRTKLIVDPPLAISLPFSFLLFFCLFEAFL